MLLLLPPAMVPLVASVAWVLASLGRLAARQGRPEHVLMAVPNAWYAPGFAPVDEFLKWDVKANAESLTARAVRLYQDLLRFHATDKDRTAFLEADLYRLTKEEVPEVDAEEESA